MEKLKLCSLLARIIRLVLEVIFPSWLILASKPREFIELRIQYFHFFIFIILILPGYAGWKWRRLYNFFILVPKGLGKQWNFEQMINHFKLIGIWYLEMKLKWPIYPFSNSARMISFFICETKVFLILFIQWQNSVSPFSWESYSYLEFLIDKM